MDSLEDLERERAAGDLSDADYAVLRDRYTRRAAEVLHALERTETRDRGPPTVARPTGPAETTARLDSSTRRHRERGSASGGGVGRGRRRRTVLVIGSLAIVAAVAVTIVVTQTGAGSRARPPRDR